MSRLNTSHQLTQSTRVWDVVKEGTDVPPHLLDQALVDLANEGLVLRQTINNWYDSFIHSPYCSKTDPWSLLAIIYYHAISIYLTGLFDYRPQFDRTLYPNLSASTMQAHVCSIISQIQTALSTTNIAGALFVFALRVAGARAVGEEQRSAILQMLVEISTRSFVVAEAFKLDLEELWWSDRGKKSADVNA